MYDEGVPSDLLDVLTKTERFVATLETPGHRGGGHRTPIKGLAKRHPLTMQG